MSVEEAKDPKTLPTRLFELACSEEEEVVAEVAKNPTSPLEILLLLAEYYPQEFLQNPALPLFLLENPNLLHELTRDAARALLDTKNLPSFVWESLSRHSHPKVRFKIAKHPNTPIFILEVLAKDEHQLVRMYVAENPNTPHACLEALTNETLN